MCPARSTNEVQLGPMSANGTYRTPFAANRMSAFEGKADSCACFLACPLMTLSGQQIALSCYFADKSLLKLDGAPYGGHVCTEARRVITRQTGRRSTVLAHCRY